MTEEDRSETDLTELGSGAIRNPFDQVPIPYQTLDESGTIRRVNQAWLDALGYERSAVDGAKFEDFLDPESAPNFQARWQTLLSRGQISEAEFELVHAAGHDVPVVFEATVEDGNDGAGRRVHSQFVPIEREADQDDHSTAQKGKIEALLDAAMEIQRADSKVAVYERLVDAAAHVLAFDVAIADAVEDGYLVPKGIAKTGTTGEFFDRVPIDADTVGTRVYREGEPSVIQDLEDDDSIRGDHEVRSVLTVPIGEYGVFQAVDRESGAFSETDCDLVELLIAHGRNALDRLEHVKELERRTGSLSRERNRLEAIFEAVPEPVAHIRYEDGEPIVVDVNSAFEGTFGYESATIEGRSVNKLLVPEDRQAEARDLDRAAETTDMVEREVTRLAADGERTFRLRSAVLETDGEPEMLVVYVDLSEQKARERELERENERLERFASIVSHDLRSPLTVASGHIDLLEAESDSPHVEKIERAIDRMDAIIDDVLTLTRGGKTVARAEKEPVDLADLAEEAWHAVDAADATLLVDTTQSLLADRSRLRRVFENLFWNAVDHGSTSPQSSPPGDAVEHGSTSPPSQVRENAVEHGSTSPQSSPPADAVEHGSTSPPSQVRENAVEHAGPAVTITVGDMDDGFYVADDGPGIPESERERVFESGYSTTRDGTGLGLDIVEEILEAHGWTVTLTSADTGGARFEIRTE